jgi:cytochrome P450 enzyme
MDLKMFTVHQSSQANAVPLSFRFDPFSDEFQHSPHSIYKYLRELAPVLYWEEGKAWLVTKYENVSCVLTSPTFEARPIKFTFTKGGEKIEEPLWRYYDEEFFNSTQLSRERSTRFIEIFFSIEKIDLLRSTITNIVDQQLSKVGNRFDLVTEYSSTIAVRVLASICGIPDKYLLIFSQFCYAFLDIYYKGKELSVEENRYKYMHLDIGLVLIKQIMNQRRSMGRREYLIDLILSYKYKGDVLSDSELVGFILGLIFGCLESISLLIAGSIYNISSGKRVLKLSNKYHNLWRSAVLETLRYDHFVKLSGPRYALEDSYIGDTKILKGDRIYPLVAAALRDPDFINEPDSFDINRQQPALLELGYREHDFFGNNLLLVTAEIAVAKFFKLHPSPRMKPPEYDSTHKTLRSMSSLVTTVS